MWYTSFSWINDASSTDSGGGGEGDGGGGGCDGGCGTLEALRYINDQYVQWFSLKFIDKNKTGYQPTNRRTDGRMHNRDAWLHLKRTLTALHEVADAVALVM